MKRTWACCFILDKFISIMYGRPDVIREYEMEMTFFEKSFQPEPGMEDNQNIRTLIHYFELARIVGHISTLGNSPHVENRALKLEAVHGLMKDWLEKQSYETLYIITESDTSQLPWNRSCGLAAMFYTVCLLLNEKTTSV